MGDIREQTDWALRNLAAVLEAAGTSLGRVVKATVFMKDGVDSAAMNEELKANRMSSTRKQATGASGSLAVFNSLPVEGPRRTSKRRESTLATKTPR